MLDSWLVISVALVYLLMLFVIAEFAERFLKKNQPRPWIYSLSLAIYCTSWAIFGTVSQSATTGWYLAPTYLGTILLFVFAWPLLAKIVAIAKQNKVTSIADFIAGRFGGSHFLGGIVVLICLVAIIPYISIQFKSIVNSYFIITGDVLKIAADNLITTTKITTQSSLSELIQQPSNKNLLQDTALYIAIIVAVFTLFFGTRRVDATEHHQGIMLAIAFESIVKLTAFLAVGIFAVYFVFNGFADLWHQASLNQQTSQLLSHRQPSFIYLSQAFLGMIAILCLPRQFHVLVVENRSLSELKKSRWIFPLYLLLINLFILPISLAGKLYFQDAELSAENYILMLPASENNPAIALLVFIGGISAATSMIIVSTIVLSTMISNEIIMPFAVKFFPLKLNNKRDFRKQIIIIRRGLILAILTLAYAYYREISVSEELATTGLLSMALIAQLSPALIVGLYWKQCAKKAVIIGMIAGLLLWFYTLLLPLLITTNLISSDLLQNGPWGLTFLKPQQLFYLYGFDNLTHGLIWSLTGNLFCLLYFSFNQKQSLSVKIQTEQFLSSSTNEHSLENALTLDIDDLILLAERFLGEEQAQKSLNNYCIQNNVDNIRHSNLQHLQRYTEKLLQSIIGNTSTRLIFESLSVNRQVPFEDVFSMIDEASDVLSFNRELLQSAIENISHGVSVVDKDLNLVAWNSQYLKLFQYPEELIQVGRPIEDLIQYNAQQGMMGTSNIDQQIKKRLEFIRKGSPHIFERQRSDGLVLEMRGNPMPGGGFVTSFIDITDLRNQQKKLEQINWGLEQRVDERTKELQQLNQRLLEAKVVADSANQSKTRFLAAASHDVLQPLNAASLFSATLLEKLEKIEQKNIAVKIQQSLYSAEDLLKDLIDISKLDAKNIQPDSTYFLIADLMQELFQEFSILAKEKNCILKSVLCNKVVKTDRTMLRRVLQNLLSNAIKHSKSQKILFGCRRIVHSIQIHIIDAGQGIKPDQQEKIFNEFEQLNSDQHAIEGHGLGLAIVSRIVDILDIPLQLKSEKNKGCDFFLTIPFIEPSLIDSSYLKKPHSNDPLTLALKPSYNKNTHSSNHPTNYHRLILCIDNDKSILDGMKSLLETWGYQNVLFSLDGRFSNEIKYNPNQVSLILADYHLDNNKTGVDVIKGIRETAQWDIPSVIITADQSSKVKTEVQDYDIFLLNKPIKPLSLKTLLKQVLKRTSRTQ